MSEGRKLTLTELAQLAIFLADEGLKYQNQGTRNAALVRYAQSLAIFRTLNSPNETWVAFLLFNIGRLQAQDQPPRAPLAFMESAAYVQQRIPPDEDMIYKLGEIAREMATLGAKALAQPVLLKAGTLAKEQRMQQPYLALKEQWFSLERIQPKLALQPGQPHHFEIRSTPANRERFIVAPDGVLHWDAAPALVQPSVLGLTGWEIACIDR